MSLVGQFPGLNNQSRRIIRAPTNPMDRCTVVSIFPKEIDERKHTISPGRFIIPPGTYKNPAILVVGSSSWWREIDENQPILEIPQSSIQVADSIVKDYVNGYFGFNPDSTSPGLFYVPGEHTVEGIKRDFQADLDKANTIQIAWFHLQVRLADSLWARSNGNPLAISEDAKMAARETGQENKDWMNSFRAVAMVRCEACGTLKNPEYPVCPSCKNIDLTHPKAKVLKFAE